MLCRYCFDYALLIILRLGIPHGGIETIPLKQRLMAAPLPDLPILEDQDIPTEPAAAHAVRNINAGFIPNEIVKMGVDFIFAERVEGGGGFI